MHSCVSCSSIFSIQVWKLSNRTETDLFDAMVNCCVQSPVFSCTMLFRFLASPYGWAGGGGWGKGGPLLKLLRLNPDGWMDDVFRVMEFHKVYSFRVSSLSGHLRLSHHRPPCSAETNRFHLDGKGSDLFFVLQIGAGSISWALIWSNMNDNRMSWDPALLSTYDTTGCKSQGAEVSNLYWIPKLWSSVDQKLSPRNMLPQPFTLISHTRCLVYMTFKKPVDAESRQLI